MRARSLKPGFFKNRQLAELPPLARVLFAGLWCMADREGRLIDSPVLIRAEVFPYDERTSIEKLLCALAVQRDSDLSPSFIERYEVNGHRFIQIANFQRHQNPHLREGPSRIPSPGEVGAQHRAQPGAKPGAQHGAEHGAPPGGLRTPDSGLRTPDSRLSGAEHRAGRGRDPLSPEAPEPVRSAARKALAHQAWDEEASDRLTRGVQDLPPRPPPFELASAYGPESRNDERERLLLWEGGDDEAFTRHAFEMGPAP